MIEQLKLQFVKGLESLKTELTLFKNENDLWVSKDGISNTAGNLALHLIGNINHFIGAQIGNNGFIREREKEFNDKNISVKVILENIDKTIQVVEKSFSGLTEENLHKLKNVNAAGEEKTGLVFLLHLIAHFNYHLGQINYYRRIIS